MFRLLGFCIGSAASIALLVVTIGVPELNLGGDETDTARYDAAIEELRARRTGEAAVAGREPAPEAADAGTDAASAGGRGEAAAGADDSLPATPAAIGRSVPADPAASPVAPTAAAEPEWHEFWTPFRTEIAARGFVGRLEAVTGLDYRVTRLDNGRYQVAFASDDASDVDGKLAQIAAATGLDLARNAP